MRILEVNNHSLLGMTHTEAVRVLRAVGDSLSMLVCDGFDPRKVASVEVRHASSFHIQRCGSETCLEMRVHLIVCPVHVCFFCAELVCCGIFFFLLS